MFHLQCILQYLFVKRSGGSDFGIIGGGRQNETTIFEGGEGGANKSETTQALTPFSDKYEIHVYPVNVSAELVNEDYKRHIRL